MSTQQPSSAVSRAPFPSWRPLDINALAQLTQDVDGTIEAWRGAVRDRDAKAVADGKEDIERKMAVLFAFKKQHHNGISQFTVI